MFKVGDKVIFNVPEWDVVYLDNHNMIINGQSYIVSKVNKYGSFQLKGIPFFTFNLRDHYDFFETIQHHRKRKINKILNVKQ